MDRNFYLELGRRGLRMPIGAHLVLKEKPNHHECLVDGYKLGEVVVETARRFNTPLALPLMDLTIEKHDMLTMIGIPPSKADTFHFSACPTAAQLADLDAHLSDAPFGRLAVYCDALRYVAKHPELVPVAMAIGPFSLMTKLLADPITPVYLAGTGVTGDEDPEVKTAETALEMAIRIIARSIRIQVAAGARAVCLCEPAANTVFLSPHQLSEPDNTVFERMVMAPNRRLRALLKELDADLIFHNCGELIPEMIRSFCTLDPAIISLGSSRTLWEDEPLIPKTTVIFGNLPTKKFYSDAEMPESRVEMLSNELAVRMQATGHPFILGSECDVLSVEGSEEIINSKVDVMMRAGGCGCSYCH